jgi:hypothetical protein
MKGFGARRRTGSAMGFAVAELVTVSWRLKKMTCGAHTSVSEGRETVGVFLDIRECVDL